jgi:type I restriction enzyme S subunit
MNLNTGLINSTPIPLPSAQSEQRAIAAALSDADALLAKLDALIAKKRDLKQAAMQQLLTGQTRLPGFSGEWETKRVGEVADVDPDNLGSVTPPSYAFSYISLEDVDSGVLRSYTEQVFCTAPSRARRRLQVGDVLVSTVRPNLKSHLLFNIPETHWVCSTGFSVVRCREGESDPAYVFFQLFGYGVARQIDALLTGSNYPAINSGDVRALEINFPSYREQTAIATVLSDIDAEISALEARRDKTRALKQGMMQELLTGRIRLV